MANGTGELKRSQDRVIAGVCAGIAERYGWPVDRTRIAYVLISLISVAFPGTIVYLVLWFLLPEAD